MIHYIINKYKFFNHILKKTKYIEIRETQYIGKNTIPLISIMLINGIVFYLPVTAFNVAAFMASTKIIHEIRLQKDAGIKYFACFY